MAPHEVNMGAMSASHPVDNQDETPASQGLGFLRNIVSVRGAIAGLCLIVIVFTGVGTGLFAQDTCDSALSQTRDQSDHSLAMYRNSSDASLSDTVTQLLFYASSATETAVRGFFEEAYKESHRLEILIRQIHAADNKQGNWSQSLRRELWHQVHTATTANHVNIIGATIRSGGGSITLQHFYGILFAIYSYPNRTTFELGLAEPITGLLLRNNPYHQTYISASSTTSKLMSGFGSTPPLWNLGDMRWSSLETYTYGTIASFTSRMEDPAGSVSEITTMTHVSLNRIRDYLHTIASTTGSATGAETRIYTSVRGSWIVDRMQARGGYPADMINSQRQTDMLTGVSHGLSVRLEQQFNPHTNAMDTVAAAMRDIEADDAVVRGVANAIHSLRGGYEEVFALPSRSTHLQIVRPQRDGDFNTTGDRIFKQAINDTHLEEPHYVTVTRVNSTKYGLDWWLTVSLNAQHVLENVELTSREVEAETESQRQQVTDNVSEGRLRSWLFIAGLAVFLVVASILATHFVLRPILVIQDEMANVAQMKLKKVSANVKATSPFHEVRDMQANFLQMAANLLEYRAYVPESVLHEGSSGSSTEMTAERRVAPTGDVAVMFTDIQGSTQLWKRSAADMNTALEQHNQIIRDVYRQHDGYEVKTIGDSFMLTFQDTVSAVRVALEIQHRFKQASWPERLRLPEAGLVVRIGINCGNVIVEENPITGRVDYRGSTINMASRLEAKARGGTVCITPTVVSAIEASKGAFAGLPHHPLLHPIGRHELRGLGDGHELYLITPGYLRQRYSDLCKECTPVEVYDDEQKEGFTPRSMMSQKSSEEGKIMSLQMKKTELFLLRTSGTVAVCRLNTYHGGKVFDEFNLLVRSAAEAAISLDGQVAAVSAAQVVVTWNASKRCRQHVTSALRFAEYLENRTQSIMRLGIATGDFLHGNVGTLKQRYTTSLGTPLLVAEAAAEYAAESDFYTIYADASNTGDALQRHESQHVSRSLFLCDVWFCPRLSLKLQVYVLNTEMLQALMNEWGTDLTGRVLSDATNEAGIKGMRDAAQLFRTTIDAKSGTITGTTLSCLEDLSETCPLAAHHLKALERAAAEDMKLGFLTRSDLSRAPPLLTHTAVPAKPTMPLSVTPIGE
eukprot:TRINITY_DN2802_c0_g1_i8.p1 TRINITY_DN2802_c0_g1~~TRINITY_DN2802_c0_g1_i8.p1  ORF type:complete len:1134 (+),score=359.80 TRINITY_DN2802_c0_g1_i8:39-3440(+)